MLHLYRPHFPLGVEIEVLVPQLASLVAITSIPLLVEHTIYITACKLWFATTV